MAPSRSGAAALRLLLRDFAEDASVPLPPAFPAPVPAPAVDVEALVAEAVERAELALRERLEAEHAAALGAERAAHADEIERLLAAAGASAGAQIAEAFRGIEARLSLELSRASARLLLPALGEEAGRRASETLASVVRDALQRRAGAGGAPLVVAKGPRALWETLSARLAEAGISAAWEEGAGVDISASIGEEVWETRLGEFLAQAREAAQ